MAAVVSGGAVVGAVVASVTAFVCDVVAAVEAVVGEGMLASGSECLLQQQRIRTVAIISGIGFLRFAIFLILSFVRGGFLFFLL